MSKGGRWGLVALAVVVAVAAFLIAKPGGGDDNEPSSGTAGQTGLEEPPTATAPSALKPPADGPEAAVIELTGHAAGEVSDITVKKGEQVRFVVRSDEPDQIHVHGYDIEKEVAPGSPARFSFPAEIEGVFEIESHEAEHAGKDALVARLTVEPS